MELTKVKWFKTTGGKIGIVVGALALITGVVLLIKSKKKPSDKKDDTKTDAKPADVSSPNTSTSTSTPEKPANDQLAPSVDLPNGGVGCGPVKTAFDRVYNYVKCGGVWYTISKDKIKIPKWKSLADNKTATDLLNNKYPA